MPSPDALSRQHTHLRFRLGRRLFGTPLLCTACAALFLLLTSQVADGGELHQFDLSVAESFRDHAAGNPALLDFFRLLTRAGDSNILTLLTLAGVAGSLALRRYRLALTWLIAALGAYFLSAGLKVAIDRPRPPQVLRDTSVRVTSASFPSGHSLGALVCYGMLGYSLRPGRTRRVGVTLLALLVLGVGLSRLYLRAHYGSDVVAGFAVGLGWLGLCLTLPAACGLAPARPPTAVEIPIS